MLKLFTGLIQEQGKILKVNRKAHTVQLTCQASEKILADYQIGDSMAINGVCLTAIAKTNSHFTVDIMPETFYRTTFSKLKINDQVNLERALSFHGRLEGHLVSGHIDTTVRLIEKRNHENALILTFDYPKDQQGEIIPQGSIAINGVSLTVTDVQARSFSVSLIPHSKDQTNLGTLNRGEYVNVETDMIGKYIKAQAHLTDKVTGGFLQ